MVNGSGVSRGDRNRNARLARRRTACPSTAEDDVAPAQAQDSGSATTAVNASIT
jgi:hypothetical protein